MKISEWLKELLVAGIIGNLSGLFDGINDKVEQITDVVGMTPQQWNGGVFSMVKNLSETVVTPIAGIILTAVACIELLSMMIERNNMRDFDLFEVFKWLMKTTFAVMIVSNTWTTSWVCLKRRRAWSIVRQAWSWRIRASIWRRSSSIWNSG